jgi:pyruvate dehydrogenase E2 component (dihydrolipoamide acetyltransferase)
MELSMAELKLPELGENIKQGTVTKILVKTGDTIKKGQNILEVETDKAVLEVPSNLDGVVGEILIKAGAVVKVGQPVFKIEGNATPPPTRGHVQKEQQNVSPSTLPSEKTSAFESTPGKPPSASPGGISEMKLPALGENIEKGTVTKILVKVGDVLKKGQNILEIETDKAVLEVPSPTEGVIKEILIKSGTVVKVGQPIFKIEGSIVPAAKQERVATESTPGKPPSAAPTSASVTSVTSAPLPIRKDIPAAPSVRLLARELGIDIGQVPGTGKAGRISVDDVKAYCKMLNTSRAQTGGGAGMAAQPLPNFNKWGNVRREAMSNVRRKTAEHLSYAWSTIPHVTQFDKVDITELEKLRKSISGTNKKISVTPFIIKVVAAALKKFPQFNASIDVSTQEIIYKDYVNVGVAVDTDRGLLVPVLKNVDKMSILQISDELTAMAERARLKKTTIEEMQGGCFTISNLGGIGGTCFTPIVNWPEVAILGVSRGAMEQVYSDGHFTPRLMLPLSLSYDHRLVDGADGARFIRWVCEAIQQPFLLDLNK